MPAVTMAATHLAHLPTVLAALALSFQPIDNFFNYCPNLLVQVEIEEPENHVDRRDALMHERLPSKRVLV
jgi:hypothetical protein